MVQSYRFHFDGHQYTLYSEEKRSDLDAVQTFIHEREQQQQPSLSSHQKAVLMLANLALDYLKLQEEHEKTKKENQKLHRQLDQVKDDKMYDVVLDDLHYKVEQELKNAHHKHQDSAMVGARYVLNQLSKEQIKRKN